MTDQLYVATGRTGVEHAAAGPVRWTLPARGDGVTVAAAGQSLHLRPPGALLDVLEAEIYEAVPVGDATTRAQGVVSVGSARLVRRTGWDTRTAALFAIDCAAHAVDGSPWATLPDGTPPGDVLDDARRAVEGASDSGTDRLDYWARVSALRRMRRDRDELAELSRGLVVEDEARDVDAVDDPDYATVIPAADAVLVAIEALRHHLLPHLYTEITDKLEEAAEVHNLDRRTAMSTPTVIATPFGPTVAGAPLILQYEPAWAGAREAARHARQAAKDRGGHSAEIAEGAWQTAALTAVLSG
jgi:hypothetical protein